uniref:Uncharacterized protein n=1 Tax=Solanum tuberosum TaxID=4113 RepID=M1DXI9_SOLTU
MLCRVDPALKTSLSVEAKDFLYVDRLNWARTLSIISPMSYFVAFTRNFPHFGDKPKTMADSDDTREACCPSNLAWFLVIGLMFPVVTSRIFSIAIHNLDPSVFVDANANADENADANVNADADTDADLDLDADSDANADFEFIFLKVISVFLNFDFLEEKR